MPWENYWHNASVAWKKQAHRQLCTSFAPSGHTRFTPARLTLLRDYHAAIGEIIIKYNGTLAITSSASALSVNPVNPRRSHSVTCPLNNAASMFAPQVADLIVASGSEKQSPTLPLALLEKDQSSIHSEGEPDEHA